MNELSEWEGLLRLAVAAILGGAIGFEREVLQKPAGLRTHMLVTLGAALFMVVAILIVEDYSSTTTVQGRLDPTRIGSTIVTGIGFLGGGLIFRNEDRVQGLTTAAGLWVAAAIGMGIGAGYYVLGIGGTLLTLVILSAMRRLDPLVEITANARGTDEDEAR